MTLVFTYPLRAALPGTRFPEMERASRRTRPTSSAAQCTAMNSAYEQELDITRHQRIRTVVMFFSSPDTCAAAVPV
ncbi:hypothetical protein RB195_002280 [Necator americanus]|uniref:Uncharacterized protein n=1 Tax=Necator americanus TaxID=51031 RepID=A0ABR1DJ95_NECAM